MANLKDYGKDFEVAKATDSKLGLVKGGMDTHINENGEIELINNYGGPFKVWLEGTTIHIDSGLIHDGFDPLHTIILATGSTLTAEATANTTNLIWMIVNQNYNYSFVKTTGSVQAPSVSGEGTFFCILLATITYNNVGVPYLMQCHFGDIIINGISY